MFFKSGGGGGGSGGSGGRSGGGRSSSGHSNTGISSNRQSATRGGMYGHNLPNYNRSYSPEYNFTSAGYGIWPYQYSYNSSFPVANIHYELVPVVTTATSIACPNPYAPCSVPLTLINQPGSNFNYLTYE